MASTLPARFENFSTAPGALPRGPGEVAIDQATAQRYSLRVGQVLRVAGAATAARYRISGIARFAGSASFGGAGVAILTLAQAQRVSGEVGGFDTIVVAAQPGVSAADAARADPRGAAADARRAHRRAGGGAADLRPREPARLPADASC